MTLKLIDRRQYHISYAHTFHGENFVVNSISIKKQNNKWISSRLDTERKIKAQQQEHGDELHHLDIK